jgi:hypothetical protein
MSKAMSITKAVCAEFHITPDQLCGRCMKPRFIAARRKFCHLCRDAGLSYPVIGRLLDRHHTTAMHHARMPLIELRPEPLPKHAPIAQRRLEARQGAESSRGPLSPRNQKCNQELPKSGAFP